MPLLDIRIGTMVRLNDPANYIRQIIGHGFESFQLAGGFGLGLVDFDRLANEVKAEIDGRAIISSLAFFGNPLMKPEDITCLEAYIDNAHLFGCDTVIGFAGALDGQPVMESMPKFKEVWTPLVKRAEDKGIKIGFENCDMGGRWEAARYNVAHAPTFWDAMFNEIPSDNLGLCWEPCHQMNSLIDPIPQLRKYVKKVVQVHGKDATVAWDVVRTLGTRGGVQYVWHRTPGFGDTNWTDVITILRMGGYKGAIEIEGWHDPVYRNDLEMNGQVHALNYLKRCRGGATVIENPK